MARKEVKQEKRPWGLFKELVKNEKCTVKILEVEEGEALSLQKHKKREELWYFLSKGKVQLGEEEFEVGEGETVNIPKEKPHRIFGMDGKTRVLEISFGEFDENDEIRLEDKYGRE